MSMSDEAVTATTTATAATEDPLIKLHSPEIDFSVDGTEGGQIDEDIEVANGLRGERQIVVAETVDSEQQQIELNSELPAYSGHELDMQMFDADEEAAGNYSSADTDCSFITGVAGSGKTTLLKTRIAEDPLYAMMTASTGIAAVNLDSITIHSALGFFDADSLQDAYLQGSAQKKLRRMVGLGYKNVVVDEVSMVSHHLLDTMIRVFDDVNQNLSKFDRPIGLILVGDMCQLPPIADKKTPRLKSVTPWAFDASSWSRFEKNTTRLTKIWRQDDARFLGALNHARTGSGGEMVGLLRAGGVQFEGGLDMQFDGTTIVSKNDEVDRFNAIALDKVKGRLIKLPSQRWGQLRTEWKNIPEFTMARENAYVMLLSNKYSSPGVIDYANGDCGHIVGIQPSTSPGELPSVAVELIRNKQVVYVQPIIRSVSFKDRPEEARGEFPNSAGYDPKQHRDDKGRYVMGQIQYFPIRLGYASTVHKAQGLSLDRVQIDVRAWNFGNPGMVYVSLSRGRTMEGLRLVGQQERWAAQCKVDPRVKRWL